VPRALVDKYARLGLPEKADAFISRIVDILLAFPYLVFAIGMMAVMGPGMFNLMLAT
jgi:ABC-type dipeptide/oligopeptide/nickel transport system permease subunit